MKEVFPMQAAVMLPLLVRALVLAALWSVLSGAGASSWAVGAPTVALALWASLKLAPPGAVRFSPAGALGFMGFFLLRSFKGGIQVALMALRPRVDLHPARLELVLRLPTGPGQLFLAGAMSLMPGTLTLGIEHGRLHLHVLDGRLPIENEVRSAEFWVARMFRQELE